MVENLALHYGTKICDLPNIDVGPKLSDEEGETKVKKTKKNAALEIKPDTLTYHAFPTISELCAKKDTV